MANQLYAQYKGKTTAEALAQMVVDLKGEITPAIDWVTDSYDIDNNTGVNLDVIGRIVDRDRSLVTSYEFEVYECNDTGEYECGDDSVQCSYEDLSGDSDLNDEYYRLLLWSKIAKNNSDATIDDILTILNVALPDLDVQRLSDSEAMSFSIEFYGVITNIQRDFMLSGDIVPRPQGVKFSGFLEGLDMVQCGDDTKQSGDTTAQCVGFLEATD